MTSLVLLFLLGSAALILLAWGAFSVFPPVSRLAMRSFWCPFRTRRVTAEFSQEQWGGPCLDVSACTAFEPPTAITCEKLCLRLNKLPEEKAAGVA